MEASGGAAPALTGVVLAGGASRRMGADKALLDWHGTPLVDHVAARIAPACAEVLIASGDGRRLRRAGEIADAVADAGPLGGLLAGLEAASAPLVAVVAVDMPAANAKILTLLARLLVAQPPGVAAAVPVTGNRLQPLHAVYRRDAAPRLRALLERGERSVTTAARALGLIEAGPEVWHEADPDGRFARNLNRPEDLAAP